MNDKYNSESVNDNKNDIDDIKADMRHMIDEDVKRFVGQELTISSDK